MSLLFKTNYAQGASPWSYQCPDGKITRGKESNGRAFQRHECQPGLNWYGMQRADAMESTPHSWKDGAELAFVWSQQLETGFYSPNPGWSVVGPEIHDNAGGTQSPLMLETSQNGVVVRTLGGAIGSNGAPANSADRFDSQTIPFSIGTYHDCVLGLVFSADRTKGRVRYMLDGKLVVDKVCAVGYSGSSGYIKLAFYRDPNQSGNKVAAVRFTDLSVYSGSGAWEEALGTSAPPVTPPPPVVDPPAPPPVVVPPVVAVDLHALAAKVSAASNPNIRAWMDAVSDLIQPPK